MQAIAGEGMLAQFGVFFLEIQFRLLKKIQSILVKIFGTNGRFL